MKRIRVKGFTENEYIHHRIDELERDTNDLRNELYRTKKPFIKVSIDPKTVITCSCVVCIIVESLILYKVW